ncbi:hypothetical protein SUDANB58_00218 [Streptomyces sp. enrichment culture]|uniref:hypothetical protein n=1 Tax=Streptomyces sp. enrichment culture TaxID=1795815 RepID=UPI003F57B47F
MLISAVVIPLVLLAAAFAPDVYEDWKLHARQNRLPLPPPRPALRPRFPRPVGAREDRGARAHGVRT